MILLTCDPASRSSGFSVFKDGVLIHHGTVLARDNNVYKRLAYLYDRYQLIASMYSPDQFVIEQMYHKAAHQVTWAVGVICAGVQKGAPNAIIDELPIQQWKAYLETLGITRPEFSRLHNCTSEDAATAILLGLSWLQKTEEPGNLFDIEEDFFT
jgi:hypothetical protein